MENQPFVSIIIPVRNVEKNIGQCLQALEKLNYPKDRYEIIIADSESTDRTKSIVEAHRAIYVSTPKKSVCAGRNAGFASARGEIIAFSDADCVADANWIKNSLKYFSDPKIGAVGGPNFTPPDETNFAKAVGFVFNQAIFAAGSIHARQLKQSREVVSLPGCNMIFRRAALDKVFPMDETMYGGEDYATNQLIRAQGYKLMYTPDTFVWHYHRPTPKRFFRQMFRYGVSRLIIARKNQHWINAVHIIAGFGIPLVALIAITLILISPKWFLLAVAATILFLIFYFFYAWTKIKSVKSALLVPYVIILLFISWSLGFLKELISPIQAGSEKTSASQTA